MSLTISKCDRYEKYIVVITKVHSSLITGCEHLWQLELAAAEIKHAYMEYINDAVTFHLIWIFLSE